MKYLISLTLLLIFLGGCGSTPEEQLNEWAEDKNVSEIIKFVKNFSDPKFEYRDSTKLEHLAWHKLYELKKEPEAFSFLESQMFDLLTPLSLRMDIFDNIYQNVDLEKMIKMMIDVQSSLKDGSGPKSYLSISDKVGYFCSTLEESRSSEEILGALYLNRDRYLNEGKISELLLSYEMQEKLFNIKRNKYENSFYRNVKALNSELEPIERGIGSFMYAKSALNHNELYSSIRDIENKVEELNKELEKHKTFWINGYIIAFSRNIIIGEEYEILRYGHRTHALLQTRSVVYKTKGSFSLKVKLYGTTEVTVKEEFGGFTQTWDVYEEATEEDDLKYSLLKERLKDKEHLLQVLEEIYDKPESERTKYCNSMLDGGYIVHKKLILSKFISKYKPEYDNVRASFNI